MNSISKFYASTYFSFHYYVQTIPYVHRIQLIYDISLAKKCISTDLSFAVSAPIAFASWMDLKPLL